MSEEKKLLKIRFEILVESVTSEYKSPFTFKIMFKKGGITCESLKQYKYINGSRTEIKINEKFNYNTHIIVQLNDDKKDEISEKLTYYFLVLTSNGYKPASNGEIKISDLNYEEENNLNLEFKKHSLTFLSMKVKINATDISLIDYNIDLLKEESITNVSSNLNRSYIKGGDVMNNTMLNTTINTVNTSFSNNLQNNTGFTSNVNSSQIGTNNNTNLLSSNTNNNTYNSNSNSNLSGKITNESIFNKDNKNNNDNKDIKDKIGGNIHNIPKSQTKIFSSSKTNSNDTPIIVKNIHNINDNESIKNTNTINSSVNVNNSKININSKLENDKNDKNERIANSSTLNENDKSNSNLLEQNNKMSEEIKKMTKDLKDKDSEISLLKENIEFHKDSYDDLKSELAKIIEEKLYLDNIHRDKMKLISSFEDKIKSSDYLLESLNNKLIAKEADNTKLNEENKKINEDLLSSTKKIDNLNKEITNEKSKNTELSKKIQFLESKIEDLTNNLNVSNNLNSSNNKINTNTKEIQLLNNRIQELESFLTDKDNLISNLKEDKENNTEQLNNLNDIIKDLTKEKSKLYDERIKLAKASKEEIDKLKSENFELESTLNEFKDIVAEINEKREILEIDVIDLKKQLEVKNREIKTFSESLENQKNMSDLYLEQIKDINEKISKKDVELNDLKKEKISLSIEIESLKHITDKNVKEDEYSNLINENKKLKISFENLILENERKVDEINNSKNELIFKLEDNSRVINELNHTNSILKERVIELEELYDDLNSKKNKQIIAEDVKIDENDANKDILAFYMENKYKQDIVNLRDAIDSKEELIKELEKDKVALNNTVFKLQNEISNANRNLKSNENAYSEFEELKDKFEIRESELLAEIDYIKKSHKEEIDRIQEKLQKVVNDKSIELELSQLKSSLRMLSSENTLLKVELNDLKSNKEKDTQLIHNLQNAIKLNKDESSSINHKLTILEEKIQLQECKLREKDITIELLNKDLMKKSDEIISLLNQEIEDKQIQETENEKKKEKKKGGFLSMFKN